MASAVVAQVLPPGSLNSLCEIGAPTGQRDVIRGSWKVGGRSLYALKHEKHQCRQDSSRKRFQQRHGGTTVHVSCSNGSMAEDFNEDDPMYISTSVVDAVDVSSGRSGFVINLSDGRHMTCGHVKTHTQNLPTYSAQSAMVLRMEDGSGIMLPIIVLETPNIILREAMSGVPSARPTVYQVIRDLVELMGHEVKLVRITHKVHESYFARVYLSKACADTETIFSLDLRPSDAINLAVRSKVPIQVHRDLVLVDGVKAVGPPMHLPPRTVRTRSVSFVMTDADKPKLGSCNVAEELTLVMKLNEAAAEERYADAARLRDELYRLVRLRTNKARQDQF